MYEREVMLDLCIYIDSSFNEYGYSNRIIDDIKSSGSKRHILLKSVEDEFYRVYQKLDLKIRLEVTKLARINNETIFLEKLSRLKKMKNGQIFDFLDNAFEKDLFPNRKKLFHSYNIACKKLHQDFINATYTCHRYDNSLSDISSEIAWIKTNFVDFVDSEHSSDTQHLAGAIKYNQTNKIFISEDKIFKQFEVIKTHKEKLNTHNLNIYSPEKYIELDL